MAPEMVVNTVGYTTSVDWWALGVLVFEMVAGRSPFSAEAPMQVYRNILGSNLPPFPPAAAADGGRPSAEEVAAHGAACRFVGALLTHRPSQRLGNLDGGADDVKAHEWFVGLDWKALEAGQIVPPWAPTLAGPADTRYFADCVSEVVHLAIGDGKADYEGLSDECRLLADAHFAPFDPFIS
ncbi:kinase-like domain-containing protein [Pavlovales sp. CCMP2436]|nr:kinase-like domain-containing protein [Pavlovales sp. CCMP2436]